ncbi:UDP-N-acetylmuramoyl-tripeptide--D-alanyl-D-alanine ligase [candidate division WOR-3 bacterium]|nr:UDP-N-acetylmuramoyl-tripeptide--D-alanyl-D-alanine ligase [candidate division WOR-3 bacterium]
MRPIELKTVINVLNGKAKGITESNLKKILNGVSVDSRTIQKGELFFALKGSRFDGHNYVDEAVKKSGLPAVVDRKVQGEDFILVQDSLLALGEFASYYRKLVDPLVIAITGSAGKTTTKEFLGAIFAELRPTLTSFKNYNNRIGVPLNIFRLEDEEVAILELATNEKGEIKRLSEITKPDLAVITSIGYSHLQAFKDKKGVLLEKKDIMEGLSGPLFIDGDDELLSTIKYDGLKRFGLNKDNDYSFGILQESIDGSIFGDDKEEFYIYLPGVGAIKSALAATAVAFYYKIPSPVIQKGLASIKPIPQRLEIKRRGDITIIDDTYNSNPDSLINSISFLSSMPGRKLAVLGPMLELGERSLELHRISGKGIRGKVDGLFVIGEEARGLIEGFGEGVTFKDKDEAFNKLKSILKPGDIILCKSSHSLHLETLVSRIEEEICSISYTH